jgi:fatty acid desaturase
MNFHAAHHLWLGIPYYNLPEADRRMREHAAAGDPRLVVRASYVGYLLEYLRWRMRGSASVAALKA